MNGVQGGRRQGVAVGWWCLINARNSQQKTMGGTHENCQKKGQGVRDGRAGFGSFLVWWRGVGGGGGGR